MLGKKKYRRYKQGVFKPKYPKKCISDSCIYRSGLELKFMRWCDNNSNVLAWGSESVVIPYTSPVDNRVHRYFVDNIVILRDAKIPNKKHKYLIEIKPSRQTVPPKTTNRKSKKNLLYEQVTYAKNAAKWKAAKQWCKKNNYQFMILTEKDLDI
jgi:hypothetical protein